MTHQSNHRRQPRTESIVGDEVDMSDIFFDCNLLWATLIDSKLRSDICYGANKQMIKIF